MTKLLKPFAATIAASAFCALLLSFQIKKLDTAPLPPAPPAIPDTLPTPKPPAPPRIIDFGDLYKELDRAEESIRRTRPDLNIPEPPLPPQVHADAIERALKAVDWDKLEGDINHNMEALKKTQGELAKIDVAAIRQEVAASMQKAKEELTRFQQVDMKKLQAEMNDLKPRLEAEMKKAQVSLDNARDEIKEFENLVNDMAADGLLEKSAYRIEHKEKTLYINGQKQPDAVYNKYRNFLEKHQNLLITKDKKGLQINQQGNATNKFD